MKMNRIAFMKKTRNESEIKRSFISRSLLYESIEIMKRRSDKPDITTAENITNSLILSPILKCHSI